MCLTQTLGSICGSMALQESLGLLRDDQVKLPKLRVRSERGIQKGVNITISGRTGDDAKHYQIRDVKRAIEMVTDEEA